METKIARARKQEGEDLWTVSCPHPRVRRAFSATPLVSTVPMLILPMGKPQMVTRIAAPPLCEQALLLLCLGIRIRVEMVRVDCVSGLEPGRPRRSKQARPGPKEKTGVPLQAQVGGFRRGLKFPSAAISLCVQNPRTMLS